MAPGTSFERLPPNYCCPDCQVSTFAGGRKHVDMLEN
ncbi:MAG: rubredoxin [Methanoregulaceae archaeon]|nr:rubredoxin [Methanoregulaceae archaeon]